jgi:hypothetical protein
VAYGENADDARRTDRPGARAAVAHTVLRPLAEEAWTRRPYGVSLGPWHYHVRTSRPPPAWPRGFRTSMRYFPRSCARLEPPGGAVSARLRGFAGPRCIWSMRRSD